MLNEILSHLDGSAMMYGNKSLTDRISGKFYTPDLLALELAERLTELVCNRSKLGPIIRICDPFCGDGRLIVALLCQATERPSMRRRKWIVTLRDIDKHAITAAEIAVRTAANNLGLKVEIRKFIGDSFLDHVPQQHDVVVTNPPWELIKPDVRELASLSHRAAAMHRTRLRNLCNRLNQHFPEANAEKAFAGWGTNLARCGWALALRSCVPNGALGIVLPGTIFADQASREMRRSAFHESTLVSATAYPPEARLFARVDQPVVTATFLAKARSGINATLSLYKADRTLKCTSQLLLSERELVAVDYSLPIIFGGDGAELLKRLSLFPKLSDLEGVGADSLWAGRELDETRILDKTVDGGRYPFAKGRNVKRHGFAELPTRSVRAAIAKQFKSIEFERIVWRDVSRSSQHRRMITAIVPSGWVTGNSLHVAYFRDGNPTRLRALYAVMASLVFEFQVRSRLGTGHMSLGVVRSTRIPQLDTKSVRRLSALSRKAFVDGKDAALEVHVAREYGLCRDAFAAMLDFFPKMEPAHRTTMVDKALWVQQ